MEDSEFTDSLTDANETSNQDADFRPDNPSRSASFPTTLGSNFTPHTALTPTTPGPYLPSQVDSPSAPLGIFHLHENEFPAALPNAQDGSDLFGGSSTPAATTFFNPNDKSLRLDHQQTLELGPLPSPSAARSKNDDAMMMGVEAEQEKHGGSTLILEDVQPQMVTRILNMLFESKSAVNMKIVAGNR